MDNERIGQESWRNTKFGRPAAEPGKYTEEDWEKDPTSKPRPRRAVIAGAVLAIIGAGLLISLYQVVSNNSGNLVADPSAAGQGQTIDQQIADAEELALAFLAETDPEQRLRWVRNTDQVRMHMAQWPGTVLRGTGRIERMLGHSDAGGRRMTCFVVKLPDGGIRLLEVVDSGDGPRVDWHAYARHCSADWPAIIEGRVDRADVRVSVSPGAYHEHPFADENEWTCFQLTSPDLRGAIHAYARKGTVREARMKAIILGSSGFRQHMTLRLMRREGPKGEPLFEIERTLAIGWVQEETDVEAEWESGE